MENKKVTLGDVESVYIRETVTLAAGEVRPIYGVHTFLRIYSTTGQIEVAAQNSGIFQKITAGTWIKNPIGTNGQLISLPFIRLKNLESFPVTVDLALSNGEVGDDAFLGTAEVNNTENFPLFTTAARPSDYKVTSVSVPAGGSATFTPDQNVIEWIAQNQGSDPVTLFGAAGVVLPAGADFTANLTKTFSINNTSAAAVTVVFTEFLK